MEGFDHPDILYSDNWAPNDNQTDGAGVNLLAVKNKFKDFIRQFHTENFNYKYRDTLKRNYNLRQYCLDVNIEDVGSFDETLADKLYKQPTEHIPIFEDAATEVADELTSPRPEGEEKVEDIQVTLNSDANPANLRALKSDIVSKLVKIPGIIISASGIKAKATRISIQCRSCSNVIANLPVKPGLEGYVLPRKCTTEQAGRVRCPLDPFFIMPDKCKSVDFQILKLQELPDGIPQGEIPRHMLLYCDRYLCDKVVPGNRVFILGIYSIKKVTKPSRREGKEKAITGVRSAYMRVVGLQLDTEGAGAPGCGIVTSEEEDLFRRMAAMPNIYERLANSVAPSIYGSTDIKKAVTCLLFGGSRKRLPDGLTRRGDINVLLLGDPGTAKSQLLKFVEKVAPIAVYTSGKGSSAAGLTASVMRDPASRNFVMEGGAMVLADGGVVCIDEFDKMREDDRVAIHEAMEQQTISIAKAGITTTLNSRCSVLAAANSIFGRWDETKGDENIDFLPTILSRFDMIFIVKDEHDQHRDMTLAKHIMSIHMNAGQMTQEPKEGELSLEFLKKYINYCRTRCGPRLNKDAAEKLKRRYVMMRSGAQQHEKEIDHKNAIPITVRQLEAVIRMSESLAKMQLQPFATETHVDEALRLFQVSTLDAAMSGNLAGAEGFTTEGEQEMLSRVEKQLKKRFAIGTQVSQQVVLQDFVQQGYSERVVVKVIQAMIRRGQLQHRMQRRMLYRIS
ncbi:DNA replication licensing factor Mcm5 [Anthonomus grandis grandis]|uniref:DNA replication licensing factor Mcm5 n=1 Tax=Anthonomus grandis grandis TaxID=2921223 RepID=UPI002165BA23|nr:DNA replication licensing factor Mcm5 [Anthonomus grandis grandis]